MISAALWYCVRFIERQPKYSETYEWYTWKITFWNFTR